MLRCLPAAGLTLLFPLLLGAGEPGDPLNHPGYQALRTKPLLPPDFDQETFENLWTVWPEPLRSQAEQAGPAERRKLAFSRYGLMEVPGEDVNAVGPGLGYLSDGKNGWVMNCLACHGGKVNGQVIPGLPNSHYGLQTLTEEVRQVKLRQGKKTTHLDNLVASMPLGGSQGTTNSVIFGVVLGAFREPDMSVNLRKPLPELVHHDLDPPPLWHVKKKSQLYIDGFAPKNHRVIMQFMLLPANTAEIVHGWEGDFKEVLAWIESLEAPKYPFPVDEPLAARGKQLFEKNCSQCHGTYGGQETYPEKLIPLEEIGTDPLRLEALGSEQRKWMKNTWMDHYGKDDVRLNNHGYVAPPLDGIWATAPYLHNGSVPTLWHLLHPDQRPGLWKRTENGYDQQQVGLEVQTVTELPRGLSPAEKRLWFDTRKAGKKRTGHDYPNVLTEDEKQAVLEYLKTL